MTIWGIGGHTSTVGSNANWCSHFPNLGMLWLVQKVEWFLCFKGTDTLISRVLYPCWVFAFVFLSYSTYLIEGNRKNWWRIVGRNITTHISLVFSTWFAFLLVYLQIMSVSTFIRRISSLLCLFTILKIVLSFDQYLYHCES